MTVPSRIRCTDDRGFTLIELMVVVLIIAILIGIALPTFLGARIRAQDRASQSVIRNAFTAQKTIYIDEEAYVSATADLDGSGTADLQEVEPSLTYVTTDPPAATGHNVSVVLTGGDVIIATKSASGTCFYLRDNARGATQYAESTGCDATAAVSGWRAVPW
ncbi:MAG TPA: prepilin-type N-terminal cleavage/methylation domain-containing protein [Actinomycetota bacterium]